jgi:hypothetical protein
MLLDAYRREIACMRRRLVAGTLHALGQILAQGGQHSGIAGSGHDPQQVVVLALLQQPAAAVTPEMAYIKRLVTLRRRRIAMLRLGIGVIYASGTARVGRYILTCSLRDGGHAQQAAHAANKDRLFHRSLHFRPRSADMKKWSLAYMPSLQSLWILKSAASTPPVTKI